MARDRVATARSRAGAERHGYGALSHGGRGKMGAPAQRTAAFLEKGLAKNLQNPLRRGGTAERQALRDTRMQKKRAPGIFPAPAF